MKIRQTFMALIRKVIRCSDSEVLNHLQIGHLANSEIQDILARSNLILRKNYWSHNRNTTLLKFYQIFKRSFCAIYHWAHDLYLHSWVDYCTDKGLIIIISKILVVVCTKSFSRKCGNFYWSGWLQVL